MTLVLAIALLSAVALPAFHRSLDAQDKKASADKKPATTAANNPFAGKVLLIQKKFDSSPSALHSMHVPIELPGFLIDNASVTEVAGLRCLTGHGIERVDGKPVGPRVTLPLDTIGAILEFDNAQAFKDFEERETQWMRPALEINTPAADPGPPAEPSRP
jgi:hypothetical protein